MKRFLSVALLVPMLFFSGSNLATAQENSAGISKASMMTPPASTPEKMSAGTQNKPSANMGPQLFNDVKESTWVQSVDMEQRQISMVIGRSQVLRLQRKVARISVSNPNVVDAAIISPKEIILNAKEEGAANIILWDFVNEVSVFDITVSRDPNLLHAVLNRISPNSQFEVYSSNDVFVVNGEVDSVAEQREIEQAANAFAEGSVSLVRVKEAKQVLLKIRFVELDHSRGQDFGIDHEFLQDNARNNIVSSFLPGGTSATLSESRSYPFSNPSGTDLIFDRNTSDAFQFGLFNNESMWNAYVKAIEAEGVGKIIARPNLLASDGEEASFLVGGEAAVVAISSDSVGVEYREFGTRLTFTPQILPNGKIRLTVAPEVSSLDFANGVTVNNVVIPSFTTVRTSTVVELRENQMFMIGGLLQQKLTLNDSGIPFLRRLPLIGKFFDNVDHNYQDTELLVVVTPILIDPMDPPSYDDSEGTEIETATSFVPWQAESPQREAVDSFIRKYGRTMQERLKEKALQSGEDARFIVPAVEVKADPGKMKNQAKSDFVPDLDAFLEEEVHSVVPGNEKPKAQESKKPYAEQASLRTMSEPAVIAEPIQPKKVEQRVPLDVLEKELSWDESFLKEENKAAAETNSKTVEAKVSGEAAVTGEDKTETVKGTGSVSRNDIVPANDPENRADTAVNKNPGAETSGQ